jgi:hypothetical protein
VDAPVVGAAVSIYVLASNDTEVDLLLRESVDIVWEGVSFAVATVEAAAAVAATWLPPKSLEFDPLRELRPPPVMDSHIASDSDGRLIAFEALSPITAAPSLKDTESDRDLRRPDISVDEFEVKEEETKEDETIAVVGVAEDDENSVEGTNSGLLGPSLPIMVFFIGFNGFLAKGFTAVSISLSISLSLPAPVPFLPPPRRGPKPNDPAKSPPSS